jgi:hypothetical protein
MSDISWKFGEAARLYAKNEAVVNEMYNLFKADITTFLDTLRDRVAAQVRTGELMEEAKPTYRCWWIEGGDNKEEEDVPYIWCRAQDSRIVTPGILDLTFAADATLVPYRQQLGTMLSGIQLPPRCKRVDSAGGGLSTIAVSYGEENPLEFATEPVLVLLTALREFEKKLRGATLNSSRGPISRKA